jgi:hypothetical protein
MNDLAEYDSHTFILLKYIELNKYFSMYYYSQWGEAQSTWYCGHYWPIIPAPDDRWCWLWSNWRNEDWQGKSKNSEITWPSATLSTINPTWLDPGSNPDRRCRKPATKSLSYGTAFSYVAAASDNQRKIMPDFIKHLFVYFNMQYQYRSLQR